MVAVENNTGRRRKIALAVLFGLLVLSGLTIWQASRPAQPAHVFLITLDTMRRDHIGAYGSLNLTPNIDALARQASVFDNHYTTANLTLPAHATMFTGQYPSDHGVTDNLTELPAAAITLAEQLKARGFETAAFVSALHLSPSHSGLGQGFDHYAVPDSPQRRAEETVDLTLAWLGDREARGRAFVWVHLFDPHLPYDAPTTATAHLPAPAGDSLEGVLNERAMWLDQWRSDPASVPDAWAEAVSKLGMERLKTELHATESFHRRWLPDLSARGAMARYAAEVAYADDQLGRLLEALTPHWEASLVVVTSDHGESLGEEGIFYEHNPGLHPPVSLAPLLIKWPRPSPAATRVEALTSHIDLMPMMLAAVDGSPQSEVRPDRVVFAESERGRSVMATNGNDLAIVRSTVTDGAAGPTLPARDLLGIFRGHPIQPATSCFGGLDECGWLHRDATEFRRARPAAERSDGERAERIEALRALGYVN